MKTKAITQIVFFTALLFVAEPSILAGQGFVTIPKPWQLMPNGQCAALVEAKAETASQDSKKSLPKASKLKALDPAESAEWQSAIKPFSIEGIRNYLNKYQNGGHALEAKQIIDDEKVIEAIEREGVGDHYVVPKESWPPFIQSALTPAAHYDKRDRITMTTVLCDFISYKFPNETGVGLLLSNGGLDVGKPNKDYVCFVTTSYPPMWGGAWKTPASQITDGRRMPPNFIFPLLPCANHSVFIVNGRLWNVAGDSKEPIRLVYSAAKGLVHIGGNGKIWDSDGQILFPKP